jgi:hypothetical protein
MPSCASPVRNTSSGRQSGQRCVSRHSDEKQWSLPQELGRGGAHERVRELDAHLPVDQRDADAQRGQRAAERGQVLRAGQSEQRGGHARGL